MGVRSPQPPSPKWLPVVDWVRNYRAGYLRSDLAAGFTTAVMLVPQGMGYASLAGLPPAVGLYASLVPLLAYALLGTSRELAVGPAAMDSLLVAVTVGAIAQSGTDTYVANAVLLAIMVGMIQLGLGLLGLGFVVNFLSRPVLAGFTSAAALIVGASQVPLLLGVHGIVEVNVFHRLASALALAARWHWPTLGVGVAACLLLVFLKRWKSSFPRAMSVVVFGIGAAYVFPLEKNGVQLVGAVPPGLPKLVIPPIDWGAVKALAPGAFTIALVGFVAAISQGKHFAQRAKYEVRPGQELVALGAANIAGGLFGGYPIAGSFSRTAVNAQAGAKSPLAGVVTSGIVALTLMFLTPLFYYLPSAVLGAIIFTAVLGLFDPWEPRRLWKVKRVDFWLLTVTFFSTLVVGIQQGILVGVGASLAVFLVRTSRPHFAVLGQIPGTESYLNVERHPHAVTQPGVLILRVDAQSYFGNINFLKQTLRKLETKMEQPLRVLVLDASGMNQLDSSAEFALRQLDDRYALRGVAVFWSRVKGPVRDVMECTGALQKLKRENRFFLRTHDAVQAASEAAHDGTAFNPSSTAAEPGSPGR